MEDKEGNQVSSFFGMANLSRDNFGSLFKAVERDSIAEVIRMVQFFPNFVEANNQALMDRYHRMN